MKIHIIFDIKNQPTGGGNQFLKALKNYFNAKGIYTENHAEADIFLFNSYQYIPKVLNLKKIYTGKIFIHRIDGPIRLYSKMSDKRDAIINKTNDYIADATIFQSNWSRKQNHELGLKRNDFETVITNAPDKFIFNTENKSEFKSSGKVKIIATSWSSGQKKGFAVYKWLDENLDFDKYKMTFCGNSPITFANIKHISPLPSNELAKQLKQHDIFLTASQKDPCSNSLTEAMHCGLPAIVLNDGGHLEIIKEAGEFFNNKEEIPKILEKMIADYDNYVNEINNPEIDEIAEKYLSWFKKILSEKLKSGKKITTFKILKIKILILKMKIKKYL